MGLTRVLGFLFASGTFLCAQSPEERDVTSVIQRLFDAMAAHDAAAIRAAFVPDAHLVAVTADGKVSVSTAETFATRVGAAKQAYLERMWEPKVFVRGAIAQLWALYDFHLDGKFTHCGIDTATLMKVDGTWKIAGLSYSRETANCPASPLGPVHQ